MSRRGAILAAGAYVAAFAVLVISGRTRQFMLLALAGILLLMAAVLANATARRIRDQGQWPAWLRAAVPFAITLVALGLTAFFFQTRTVDGAALFCLCAAFIGMGHVVGEVRTWEKWRFAWSFVALVVCGLAFWIAIESATSTPKPGLIVAGISLLLGPVALSALSEHVLASAWVEELDWVRKGILVVAGTAVIAVAVGLWLPDSGMPGFFGVRLAAVLVLLTLAIAANTQVDVILVAIFLGLVWTGIPRLAESDSKLVPAPVAASDIGPEEEVLVALGDSYMSGEGAKRFYEDTNVPDSNECRRAPTAYARRILERAEEEGFGTRLAFYACSGANGTDLIDNPQHPGEPPGGPKQSQSEQLKALLDAKARVPLILLSIGGNDAGFADIGTECLAPGNCVVRGQLWLDNLQQVAIEIDHAYTRIRDVAKNVPVLVVPYPQPINPDRCRYSLLESQEHQFLNGFVKQLDKVVRKAAAEHGFLYLKKMETAMKDAKLRICDADSKPERLGVNFIAVSDTEGLVDQLKNPKNWIHNSLHPNARGHRQMTETLATWMDRHRRVAAKPDAPGSDIYDVQALPELMGKDFTTDYCGKPDSDVDGCDLDSTGWALTQVAQFVRGIFLPGLLLIIGAWILALGLLALFRPRAEYVVGKIDEWLFT